MKPSRFAYHDPATRDEALALLATYAEDAKVLAGGQSLLPLLNMRLAQPAHLIDINRIAGLAEIRERDDTLAIGALTRQRTVEHSELVRKRCPLLAAAVAFVGHPAIRSRGTVGGSLAHADPAAELPAVLLALGGSIHIAAHNSRRIVPAAEFFVDQLQTSLASDELVIEARFPIVPSRTGVAFVEVSRRHGGFALVGVAAQLTLHEDHTIADAHLTLLGVAATPVSALEATTLLMGAQADDKIFTLAAEQASCGLDPAADLHASSEYRCHVARILVKRALQTAAQHAQQGGYDA